MNTIEPHRLERHELRTGMPVWCMWGRNWRAATLFRRDNPNLVRVRFDNGKDGTRMVAELFARDPELKGKDKPKTQAVTV